MSRIVHSGPTDQHHQALGTPYTGAPEGETAPEPSQATSAVGTLNTSGGGGAVIADAT